MRSVEKNQSREIRRENMNPPSMGEKALLERRATARLRVSPYPEVRRVKCDYHEGLLCLRGRVSSYYMKQLAQAAVHEIVGVEEVHNHVEVSASF